MRAGQTEGLAQDVTRFAKTALGSGLLGRKGQVLKVGLQSVIAMSSMLEQPWGLPRGILAARLGGWWALLLPVDSWGTR